MLIAVPLAGQGLPARIAAAPDGTVRMSFAARPSVCGNGRNVIALDCSSGRCGHQTIMFDGHYEGDEVEYDCEPGPVRVSLTVRKGVVQALRSYWTAYYHLRRVTLYDFAEKRELLDDR